MKIDTLLKEVRNTSFTPEVEDAMYVRYMEAEAKFAAESKEKQMKQELLNSEYTI